MSRRYRSTARLAARLAAHFAASLLVAGLVAGRAAPAAAQTDDFDEDGVPDVLELNGYNADLASCAPPADGAGRPCYVTDPRTWSSDGDPYSDYTEATGANMDSDVPPPFNHPLVAAYPIIEFYLDRYTFTPIADVTDSNGQSYSRGSAYTRSASYTHSMTGTVKSEIGFTGPVPSGSVSAEVSETVSETQSWSSTTTFDRSFSWETATTTNTNEAATLRLFGRAANRGGATGLNIQPQLNLYIGGELVDTFSPTTDDTPFAGELGPGERTPEKDLFVGDGTIVLTLDQLRALQRGAPVTIEVVDLKMDIQRYASGGGGTWACGTLDSCDWATFVNQIEARTTRLMIDFGYSGDPGIRVTDLPLAHRGSPFDYRIFTGSPFYAQQNGDQGAFGITLRDALGYVGLDVDGAPGAEAVEGRRYPDAWYVATDTDVRGVDRIDAEWADEGRPRAANGAALLLDVPLPPDAILALASPDPVDAGPILADAAFTPDLRGVRVLANPKGSLPVTRAEAHLFVHGVEHVLPLAFDGTYYAAAGPLAPAPAGATTAYVVFEDVSGAVRRTEEPLALPIAPVGACRDVRPADRALFHSVDQYYATLFPYGDLDRPVETFCASESVVAVQEHAWLPRRRPDDVGINGFYGVVWVDADRAVLVGNETIMRSTDGGRTWTRAAFPDDPAVLFGLARRTDTGTLVAVGTTGDILRSTDDGATWTAAPVAVPDPDRLRLVDVAHAGGDRWLAVGADRVVVSADDGATWSGAANLPTPRSGEGIAFGEDGTGLLLDGGTGTAGTGRIWRTTNGGATWEDAGIFTGVLDVAYAGEDTWYVTQNLPAVRRLLRSREDGVAGSWELIDLNATGAAFPAAVAFLDPERGFVADNAGVLRTDDGGATWVLQPAPPTDLTGFAMPRPRALALLDINRALMVSTHGGVHLTTSSGGIPVVNVAAEDVPGGGAGDVPAAVVLEGNYPNPFNPQTTIRYRLARGERVRLEVFDLLGRRVALLEDGVRPAGAHEVRFDAAGLASGVYLYRLSTATAAEVRRMVLHR